MTDGPQQPGMLPILAAEAGLFVTGEDFLRLTSFSGDADTELRLGGRFLQLGQRTPVALTARHVPNTDRTAKTTDIPLGEGWLQGVTVIAETGSPVFAHTFARLDLIRGCGNGATVLQTLAAGPVSARAPLAYPGSGVQASIVGPGALRVITGTDPAAAAEISETVPTGAVWRVQAMGYTLVTDANAANRESVITYDDGATVYFAAAPGANQIASLTRRYSAAMNGVRGVGAASNEIATALPSIMLPAGHRIRTATTNIQAGDNYGAPLLLVEEWIVAQ